MMISCDTYRLRLITRLGGVLICLLLLFVNWNEVECVNHGRNALPEEFPYIVRIFISEEATGLQNVVKDTREEVQRFIGEQDAGTIGFVATGVLITLTRVLTTCDSVGFFTYARTVKYYNTSLVAITGGTVHRNQGGVTVIPTNSSVHPYCYFLMSGYVLHNYGFYEVDKFEGATVPEGSVPMKPITSDLKSSKAMETALRNLYTGRSSVQCYTAGWGFPKTYDVRSTQINFDTNADILQATEMKVVDYDYCYQKTCQFFNDCLIMIWEYGYVCAEADRGGPCLNDKGAPLICGGQLYAIHNNPLSCMDEGLPRHFVRIDLAFNYIFDIQSSSTINRVAMRLIILLIANLFRSKYLNVLLNV